MSNDAVIKLDSSESYHGKVALPYNQEQFQQFLIGLLGKPQLIEKTFEGNYEVDIQYIANMIELIEQRIHQQNEATLLQMRSTIYYNDYSSVSLNGFEHLINYNEPQPLVCKALSLTLQYLIKFKDKEVAEKQEINISFYTTGDYQSIDRHYYRTSSISISIAHTARTFGADIESLLSRYFTPLVTQQKFLAHIHRMDDSTVHNMFKFFMTTLTIVCAYNWIDLKKTHILVLLFASIYAFSCLISVLINYVVPSSRPSFILITRESYVQREKDLKKYKREWLKFWVSTVGGLIVGVIGNYIYAYLTK